MRIARFRYFQGLHHVAAASGTLVDYEDVIPDTRVEPAAMAAWIDALPVALSLEAGHLAGPLDRVCERLLVALTEPCRLEPSPSRVLPAEPAGIRLWVPVDDREGARCAAELLCLLVDEAGAGRGPGPQALQLLGELMGRQWTPTTAHLARAARTLQIPFHRVELQGRLLLQLGQGRARRLFLETLCDRPPARADWCLDRVAFLGELQRRGLPVPPQTAAHSLEECLAEAQRIGWPVVLQSSPGGRGAWLRLGDAGGLEKAWRAFAPRQGETLLLQPFLPGALHRLLLGEGQVLAVAELRPAEAVGDGRRSVAELVAALNADPRRGKAQERPLGRVALDGALQAMLAQQQLSLASIPPAGRRIRLSPVPDPARGGIPIDRSASLHPENRRLAEAVATLLGAEVVAVDIRSRDLSVPWSEGGTWILGATAGPGLAPYLAADPGTDLGRRLVGRWMGTAGQARIPTALVTGSIGKTTTTRMLAHILRAAGLRVGLTCTTGMEFDGAPLRSDDCSGGAAVRHFLEDPRVEAVVGEIARGGLLWGGLVIEEATVSAVLNIRDCHIGEDGIRSRADLARIKGSVARAARTCLVLNADDPLTLAMGRSRRPEDLVLVGHDPPSEALETHLASGQRAVLWRGGAEGFLRLQRGRGVVLEIGAASVPASSGGLLEGPLCCAAFAVALAHALEAPLERIAWALRDFGSSSAHNPGRLQTVLTDPFRLVLAFPSQIPEPMHEIGRWVRSQPLAEGCRRRALFRVNCAWTDERAVEMALAAAPYFDQIVFATSSDLQGRGPREIQGLMSEAVQERYPAVLSEIAAEALGAIPSFLDQGRPGDLLMVLTVRTAESRAVIEDWSRTRGASAGAVHAP